MFAPNIPNELKNLKTLDEYLENNLKCECFLHFCKSKNVIFVCLDKPKFGDMKIVKGVGN